MTGKKFLFLFLALILPVGIFLFLKVFGRNQFDVAPLYLEGKIDVPGNCNLNFTTPYRLQDSVMSSLRKNGTSPLYLIHFDDGTKFQRVEEETEPGTVKIVSAATIVNGQDISMLRCLLITKLPSEAVLLDNEGRIRGYYDHRDRDEIDRLIVEAKIISKQY